MSDTPSENKAGKVCWPGLEPEIIELLAQPLDPKRVKHRRGGGNTDLAYLKGHDVIDTANRIFKPGRWGYDIITIELNSVAGDNGEIIGAYYSARVRLTISGCVPITEEGVCSVQESKNPKARVDAHDVARKGSVTDALKRALRCYGDPFGNSLYDTDIVDGQEGVLTADGRKNEKEFASRSKLYNLAKSPNGAAQRPVEKSSRPSKPAEKQNLDELYAYYSAQFEKVTSRDTAEALWDEAKRVYVENGHTEDDVLADLKPTYTRRWREVQAKTSTAQKSA
jgi:DNA recombination protein Rad52